MERKMAFYEIGRGQLGRDLQEHFEKAQAISTEREVDVKIKLEIVVHKPDQNDEEYIRSVSYSHELKQPPMRSRKFNTVHKDGVIVKDAAETPEQTSLLDLELDGNKTVKFHKTVNEKE